MLVKAYELGEQQSYSNQEVACISIATLNQFNLMDELLAKSLPATGIATKNRLPKLCRLPDDKDEIKLGDIGDRER